MKFSAHALLALAALLSFPGKSSASDSADSETYEPPKDRAPVGWEDVSLGGNIIGNADYKFQIRLRNDEINLCMGVDELGDVRNVVCDPSDDSQKFYYTGQSIKNVARRVDECMVVNANPQRSNEGQYPDRRFTYQKCDPRTEKKANWRTESQAELRYTRWSGPQKQFQNFKCATGSSEVGSVVDPIKSCDLNTWTQQWVVKQAKQEQPVVGSGSGDPHFKTFGGEAYDFHGQCDLVLVDAPSFHNGSGFSIHIRTKIEKHWSFIDSAVIKIGRYTFEMKGGSTEDGTPNYWVNGRTGSDDNLRAMVESIKAEHSEGFEIHYHQISAKQHKFRISLNRGGDAISMQTYKNWVAVHVKTTNQHSSFFDGAKGLMGAYPTGQKVARDGVSIMEDNNAFGQEWQVLGSEPMLFQSEEDPQQPEASCIMPSTSASAYRRRLGESAVTKEDAEQACQHAGEGLAFRSCVFDVLATNDKDVAGAY